MSDFMDDFFDTESMLTGFSRDMGFCPVSESFVKDRMLHVRVELPGVDPEDVTVSFKDGCLRISGERKRNTSEEDMSYHVEEMSYGCFSRSFSLPEGTDTEKIHASFDKGVLDIRIPLPDSAVEKKIPIEGVHSETKSMQSGEDSPKLSGPDVDASPGEMRVQDSTSA